MTSTLIIHSPQVETTTTGSVAKVLLECPEGRFDLFFEVSGATLHDRVTPYAAMCLPLAMARGWTLRTESPISSKLLKTIPTIQQIYRYFLPGTQTIQVQAPTREEPDACGRTSASFFSGGVDSYYTYLKHRERITRLIFATGFDIRLTQTTFASHVQEQVRQMADELGAGLIAIKSNIRDFSDQFVHWRYYHGAVLGGTASLLANELDTVFIASSQNYGDLFAWGSHPILDPLWSTEAVQVINDGCEAKRLEKLQLVVQNDVAVRRLRVCFNNKYDRYNCNRCEKCFRTKVALYALGVLEKCETFKHDFDLKQLSNLRYGSNGNVVRANLENYEYLRKHRPHPQLERALRMASRRPSLLKTAKHRIRSLFRKPVETKTLGVKVK